METDEEKLKKSRIHLPSAAVLGLALAFTSAGAAIIAGFGSRWGLWHFSLGFRILAVAALGGALSAFIAAFGLVTSFRRYKWRDFMLSCVSLAIGLTIFGVPFSWYRAAKTLPLIHDIATDTENPPQFVALLPLRKGASNPSEYGGPDIAEKQHEAYPDIKPLILGLPASRAFDKARTVARRMGWDIVSANKQELRIEATDTTTWFGFKDDIVVRITAFDDRSRLDVRSVSRIGLSDVGTNARRIREYLKEIAKNS